MKSLFPGLSALACITLFAACGRMDPQVAAVIGDRTVDMEEFREAAAAYYRGERQAAAQTGAALDERLQDLVLDHLVIQQAWKEGWNDRPQFVKMRQDYENEYIEREIYELKVAGRVVNDSLLADTWNRQGTEIKSAHILFRWGESVQDSSRARSEARRVYNEIRDGLDFGDAAARYTEERGGQQRAGELDWFTWGGMTPAFQRAAWDLPVGEVSSPVETEFGVHLIEVQDRRAVQVRPGFEESKEELRRSTMNALRDQLVAFGLAYLDSLHREYSLEVREEAVAELYRLIERTRKPEMSFAVLIDSLRSDWSGKTLVHWIGGDVGLEELREYVETRYIPVNDQLSVERLVRGMKDMMLPRVLARKGRELNLQDDPEIQAQVQDRLERSILSAYKDEAFKEPIRITDEDIEHHYEAHQDEYYFEEHVRVQEILVDDEDLATMLLNRVRNGEDFGELAGDYTTRPGKKRDKGVLESFPRGRYGAMGDAAFTMEPGELGGPYEMGRRFSVIQMLEKVPPRPKPLDQASTSIRYRLEREEGERLVREWRQKAEKSFPVQVNPDAVRLAFPEKD